MDQNHSLKPNPVTGIQEGWRVLDYLSHHPESTHVVRLLACLVCVLWACRGCNRQVLQPGLACSAAAACDSKLDRRDQPCSASRELLHQAGCMSALTCRQAARCVAVR